jgi:hypothetical protein
MGLAVHESEPHMSEYFDQPQVIQTTQTESQVQEDTGMLPGTESRADLLFKSADGAKVILVDVTSTSGISKHPKLHQYTPREWRERLSKGKQRVIDEAWLFVGFGLGVEEVRGLGLSHAQGPTGG